MVKINIIFLSLFFSFSANAVPMTLIYDQAQPAYYQTVASHFLNWYEKTTAQSVRKHLSEKEKKYIQYCLSNLSDWSYQMNPGTYWNRLRVTLQLSEGQLLSGRLAIGPSNWDPEVRRLAQAILKDKGVKIPKSYTLSDVLWFEWDLDRNEFSIYFKDRLDSIKDLLNREQYEANILKQMIFNKKGELKGQRAFASLVKVPADVKRKYIFYPAIMDVVDILEDGKVQDQIFELRSFDDRFMDDPIRLVANAIDFDFRILADSMIYRTHQDMEIYYP